MAELRLENSIVDERYLTERCLGRGSYAEIFLAYDRQRNDAPIIIKALNTQLQGTPDVDLQRTLVENFQNEALALDKVRHPHIIRRLGHGTASDLEGTAFHYLVLEYMTGGDMLSLCGKAPFSLKETLFYFEQVAEALAYAHSQGVIHRDIKPKNLLLSGDFKTVKICDFGVARLAQSTNLQITRVGAEAYAPPEHHPDSEGEPNAERLTPSADVYSLAKTIYTAMTGRAPRQFSRKPITYLTPELEEQNWGEALLMILRKATATHVTDRYASVQEFWTDFASLQVYLTKAGDDEKTEVRPRLKGTSNVEKPRQQPNFQAVAAGLAQKARIIIELQNQKEQNPVSEIGRENRQRLEPERREQEKPEPMGNGAERYYVRKNNLVREDEKKVSTPPREHALTDDLRAVVNSPWSRRAVILLLILMIVGVLWGVYSHIVEKVGISKESANKEAQIINSKDQKTGRVNLRSAPYIDPTNILTEVPSGTKVRLLQEENDWSKVKIVEVPDGSPVSVDTGWVKNDFIKKN